MCLDSHPIKHSVYSSLLWIRFLCRFEASERSWASFAPLPRTCSPSTITFLEQIVAPLMSSRPLLMGLLPTFDNSSKLWRETEHCPTFIFSSQNNTARPPVSFRGHPRRRRSRLHHREDRLLPRRSNGDKENSHSWPTHYETELYSTFFNLQPLSETTVANLELHLHQHRLHPIPATVDAAD